MTDDTGAGVGRRKFLASGSALAGAMGVAGCSDAPGAETYELAAARTWRMGPLLKPDDAALVRELVRYATLAPSSHNTQCWKFSVAGAVVSIVPDLSRRCPAVDPDDHHVFVSLGCAAENLAHAALAHGLHAQVAFDVAHDGVRVTLTPTQARSSSLFQAIAARQCTRGDYDAQPLSVDVLAALARAGNSDTVRILILTDRPSMERVLEQVVHANTQQMADPAFMKELKSWIRFNGAQAVRTRDGLFSASSGSPEIPTWLGDAAFGWLLTAGGENDRYARQIRNSSGLAVFVGAAADKAHWVDVGRSYERFALQATALGVRNAMLNQPVEVASVRPQFAQSLGLGAQRPDLVVRFGRGPALPASLRRPVDAVLA